MGVAPGLAAFLPARIPFPVMHVDTGAHFPESWTAGPRGPWPARADLGVVARSRSTAGRVTAEARWASRKTVCRRPPLDSIEEHRFDRCSCGGRRRDRIKAGPKERMFLLPRRVSQWDPKEPTGPSF